MRDPGVMQAAHVLPQVDEGVVADRCTVVQSAAPLGGDQQGDFVVRPCRGQDQRNRDSRPFGHDRHQSLVLHGLQPRQRNPLAAAAVQDRTQGASSELGISGIPAIGLDLDGADLGAAAHQATHPPRLVVSHRQVVAVDIEFGQRAAHHTNVGISLGGAESEQDCRAAGHAESQRGEDSGGRAVGQGDRRTGHEEHHDPPEPAERSGQERCGGHQDGGDHGHAQDRELRRSGFLDLGQDCRPQGVVTCDDRERDNDGRQGGERHVAQRRPAPVGDQ